ncbi:MAG: hemolysin III family protein [Bacilli bacterium]|nr:hemolysin III family protein [Bacilli bacterium]
MVELDRYLMNEINISKNEADKIIAALEKYESTKSKKKLNIRIPVYTLGEELFNAISHGFGAALSIVALILMVIKANGALKETTVALFGATMIILYTISCVYHALSRNLEGKKVLRVIDHCNVFLLVYGTYIPISLVGVGGVLGLMIFLGITIIISVGITATAIKIDKTSSLQVICHLLSGWGILFFIKPLSSTIGLSGIILLILGGIMYTIGSVLYGIGRKKKYMHSIFHIFCLLGTLFHFLCVYLTLL